MSVVRRFYKLCNKPATNNLVNHSDNDNENLISTLWNNKVCEIQGLINSHSQGDFIMT